MVRHYGPGSGPRDICFINRGTNGVSCIVVRSDGNARPAVPRRYCLAVCFDAEGSKTLLQDYIYTAELRARGMDAKQVHLR